MLWLLASAPFLAGCAGVAAGGGGGLQPAASRASTATFLLPLSGRRAALGESMRRAVMLAQSPGAAPDIRDSGDTAQTAATAARNAGELILGPLTAAQTRAVLPVAGGAPMVSFSNDAALTGSGAFVFGVTPSQSAAAIFRHAASRGLRRVAVVVGPGPFGARALAAAAQVAPQTGVTLAAALTRDPAAPGLVAALPAPVDAVFLPGGGASLALFAAPLAAAGIPILGGAQWATADPGAIAALDGAAHAAPPAERITAFAGRYASRHGERPGMLAALAHDAATMAIELSRSGQASREGIAREQGFAGILGDYRFRPDGACLRVLSVATVGGDGAA